jgi:cytochrome b
MAACPGLPGAAPGLESASGARGGWGASLGLGAKSPRQPRKTNRAKTSSRAGKISFLAVIPPDWLTFIRLSPGRGTGGKNPLLLRKMMAKTSRCHDIGLQQGPELRQDGMDTHSSRIRIWDRPVRLFHWTLIALVAASYASGKGGAWTLHYASGYAILTLVLFRVLWGFFGSENARFAHFLRSPLAALRQLGGLTKRDVDRETSHNPAGGWMVVVLLALLFAQASSGLFANHDPGFSYSQHGPLALKVSEATSESLTTLHLAVQRYLLLAIALHVLAIMAYKLVKGHELVMPMLTGEKLLPIGVRAPKLAPARLALGLLALAGASVFLFIRYF